MTPSVVPLVRVIRCEHSEVLPGTIGVVVGLKADGLAIAVTVRRHPHPDATITVYVERGDIEPVPVPAEPNGQAVALPLLPS